MKEDNNNKAKMNEVIAATEKKLLTWRAYWKETIEKDIPFGYSTKCILYEGDGTIFPDFRGGSCMPHLTKEQLQKLPPARIDWLNIKTNNALRDISFDFLNVSCSLSKRHNEEPLDYKINFSLENRDFSMVDSRYMIEVKGDNIAKKIKRNDAIIEIIEKSNPEDSTKRNKTCVVQLVEPSKKINHTFVIKEANGNTQINYYSRKGKKVSFYNDEILFCTEKTEFKEKLDIFSNFINITNVIHNVSLTSFNTSYFIANLSQGVENALLRVRDESPIEYLAQTIKYYSELQQLRDGKKSYVKGKYYNKDLKRL